MKGILAAFIFFTRLPLWKLKMFQLPKEAFEQCFSYWAVVGWLTGAVMAAVLWLSSQILPLSVAVTLALFSRLMLTGALHEDGLADFFDGFGGGMSKERILEIMKDSHIGTYGVLALVFYFGTSWQILHSITDVKMLCLLLFIADPFAKMLVSTMTVFLPYARNEETSKAKIVYQKMGAVPLFVAVCFGILPLLLLPNWQFLLVFLVPIFLYAVLLGYLKGKIQGYTGDCCGALFLLCEFSIWLGFLIVIQRGEFV